MDFNKSKEQLFSDLLESLKNKAVYSTLKNIVSGRKTNVYCNLKGLSSLFTHVCIELERGNMEYFEVLNEVHCKIHETMKSLKNNGK